MMRTVSFLPLAFAAGFFVSVAYGRSVPDNLQAFYDQVKDGSCPVTLKKGLSKDGSNKGGFCYCSDRNETLMWITGPSSLADMDIDCDGANNSGGRCANDPTGQSITAFQGEVAGYGIKDLDANLHSYVVLGTKKFDPRDVGVESLSVVAVVCNAQLFYGVWGDQNADNLVGEASISLATACFGDSMTGDSGHSKTDVLYLAFRSHEAKPSSKAMWSAKSFSEFEESLSPIGDALLAKFLRVSNDQYNGTGDNTNQGGGSQGDNGGVNNTPGVGLRIQVPGLSALLSLLALPLLI